MTAEKATSGDAIGAGALGTENTGNAATSGSAASSNVSAAVSAPEKK